MARVTYNDPMGQNVSFEEGGAGMPNPVAFQQPNPFQIGGIPTDFSKIKNAGLSAVNQAAGLYNEGPQFAGFGDTTNQAISQMTGLAQGNPFLPQANQAVGGVMSGQNPFLQGFQNFGNQQNQYLDGMFGQAAGQIQDRLNSQFGAGGRTGSGQHAGVMGRELGNFATNFYGNAFDNMQNRNLQALQGGSSAYGNQNIQKLQAAGMIPELNDAKFGDARQLLGIGGMVDQNRQAEMDAPYSNLQNFANIISQIQGTQTPDRPKASTTDKLIGLGLTGTSLFSGGGIL